MTTTEPLFNLKYSSFYLDKVLKTIKLYLFYNDYETSYTTFINHAHWHRCLRSDGLRVGGNRNARRKPTCLI